jgi:hypothetical protein
MFASRIVNRLIYQTLSTTPGVTAVVGDRIVRGVGYPAGTTLPACLFYMEQSEYDSGQLARAEHIDGEHMRYVVRFDDVGMTDSRIAPAAEAALIELAGLDYKSSDGVQVLFSATGEVPLTSYVDGDTFYQRLGTIYRVDVTRGG